MARAAKRIVVLKRFSDLNIQNGDAEKYVKAATPILRAALISALDRYKIDCKIKMTMRNNGIINVAVQELSAPARKELRNFQMIFDVVGNRIRNFGYYGPTPTFERFTSQVINDKQTPISISKVVVGMWARKDDSVLKARNIQEQVTKIAAFDERVIYALEAFRVKLDNILKEVVI